MRWSFEKARLDWGFDAMERQKKWWYTSAVPAI